MKHTILVDDKTKVIDVRLMAESFIVYRKMYQPPLTPDNIDEINPGDWAEHLEQFKREGWQQIIEEFFRKQIRIIGSCGILAWDEGGVIGKMYFTTKELYNRFRRGGYPSVGHYCVEHESMPRIIQSLSDEELISLLKSPSKTLRIVCFNIGHADTRYQGKGIASMIIDLLKEWARNRGWSRLEALACPDVIPYGAWAPHILRRGALERRGFYIAEEQQVTKSERKQQQAYLTRYLNGVGRLHHSWGFEEAEKTVYDVPLMQKYHKEYLMTFNL
jgi:GNAT superfamily N-acetyltransferase